MTSLTDLRDTIRAKLAELESEATRRENYNAVNRAAVWAEWKTRVAMLKWVLEQMEAGQWHTRPRSTRSLNAMSILPPNRHFTGWPRFTTPVGPVISPLGTREIASAIAAALEIEGQLHATLRTVESADALGPFVFIKLDNGQEFEAHVVERTPRSAA